MSDSDFAPICFQLPRECCGFVDENEAFDVQFLNNGRLVCYSYGKEAFTTFWIVVDSFYGSKKIVITEVNKIDDWVLLLSMNSYLLRTFDGSHCVQIVQLNSKTQETKRINLIGKERGSVQRISVFEDTLIVILSVYENRYDELVTSTEVHFYKINEWEAPINVIELKDEHFSYLDFVGCASNGNLCFFASHGRIFHVSDFDTLIEVDVEKKKVSRWKTGALSEIFGTNIEHLAKNTSGAWYNDHFYLYTTPNPAVIKLQHYFLRLSLETKQWKQIVIDGAQFFDVIEVHMSVSRDGIIVLDCRNACDERNIHRIPLISPEPLLHLSQFAVNRRHGNLAEMTEDERKNKNFPVRLCVCPAFEHENVVKYSLSTKDSQIVIFEMVSSSCQNNNWKNPALYKTRVCDFWAAGKDCRFNNKCWYAHGPHELRSVPHLENNLIAKNTSLAEVLEILPKQSKDYIRALGQANDLLNEANTDVFQRVTIPFLNSLAFKIMSAQNSAVQPQMFNNTLTPLYQHVDYPFSISPHQLFGNQAGFSTNASQWQYSTNVPINKNPSLSSMSSGSIRIPDEIDIYSAEARKKYAGEDDLSIFEPVHQRLNSDVNTYFV